MSIREYMKDEEGVMFISDLLKSARPEPPAHVASKNASIYDKVRAETRRLENEQFQVDDKRRRLEPLIQQAAQCVKRHQMHQKRELELDITNLETEIKEIETGKRIDDFVKCARPYLSEFQRQQFCRPAESERDANSLGPGQSAAAAVAAEFAVNVEGALPKYDIQGQDFCSNCREPMQLYQAYALMICPRCGSSKQFLDATASLLAYSDDYDYCSFSYKRINHFSEWLASIQAKETLDIPQSVLDTVMQRLADERITNMEDVTVHKVREILKKMKLRKYYEHVQLITCKLTGRAPPRMTPEMEEKIKVCFLAASSAFQRHCPPDRKNMISYQLVLLKLCELLGYHEFVPYFMLLKGKDKLSKMDIIWKKICEDLDWTYIPSVP